MGFFQKLKARLFQLDPEPSQSLAKKNSKALVDNEAKAQKALVKETKKLNKKTEQARLDEQVRSQRVNRYVGGLTKANQSFSQSIKELQLRTKVIDEVFFDELEEILILSDIGPRLVEEIIHAIKLEVKDQGIKDQVMINEIIADKLFLAYANQDFSSTALNYAANRPSIFLVTGVNGSGKTTSIAKLAYRALQEKKRVLIVAGDTFRAGAVAQLEVWAKRLNVDLVKSDKLHADPASVVFEGLKQATAKQVDVVIIDTAGRLQNKVNLMEELSKINRLIAKTFPGAPDESLLVIDATTGQNGLSQAKAFAEVTPLSGIILTKMDGTSRGGIVLTIKSAMSLPVKMIGLGEQLSDMEEFDLDAFIYGITKGLNHDE